MAGSWLRRASLPSALVVLGRTMTVDMDLKAKKSGGSLKLQRVTSSARKRAQDKWAARVRRAAKIRTTHTCRRSCKPKTPRLHISRQKKATKSSSKPPQRNHNDKPELCMQEQKVFAMWLCVLLKVGAFLLEVHLRLSFGSAWVSVCDAASQTPHRRPSGDSPAHRHEHLSCW